MAAGFSFFCLFPILSFLISVLFIQTSASTMGICSTRASYVYCLDSGLPSTWYNNNSVVKVGWKMSVFLQNADDTNHDIYCGFYCNGTCNSYVFSVVAVGGNNHQVLWSANGDHPVKANATLQLKREGLVLRDSDGSQIWTSNTSGNSIAGMNLNQAGNLVLFSNESDIIWLSLAEKISLSPAPTTPTTPNSSFNTPPTQVTRSETASMTVTSTQNSSSNIPPTPSITPKSSNIPPTQVTRTETANVTVNFTQNSSSNIPPTPSISPKSSNIPPTPSITPKSSFNISPTVPNLPPTNERAPKPPDEPGRSKTKLVALIAGSTAGGLLIIGIAIVLLSMKIRRKEEEEHVEDYIKQVPGMPVRFSYDDLRVATEDFKEKIGRGGFGTVFTGVLPDGSKIAVKRLDRMGQGMREFLAEVETIGSLHHFNLVRLIGFCVEKSCWLLVYEHMSNGSLDKWIFFRDQRPCLDWQTRKKIILDVAKGLTYLHEDCRHRIAHLDIKPQNILLDENFNAKVSDFGLAQLIDRDESQVQATMRGTPGYIAPEWRKSKINVKVDIYSFGIVLLEVVSARRNLDRSRSESSCHLLRLLQEKAKEDKLFDIIENLDENHGEEMMRMIKIGVWCLQDDPQKRPSMSTVVKVLEGVMEVDENIKYKFAQAMPPVSIVNNHVSTAPPSASILSNPR